MIVWLASYPRSGNTLLRTMMQQAFGLPSYSMYDDRIDVGALPEVRQRTGHQFLGSPFEKFYAERKEAAELSLVKTHDPPPDAGKAIYIIRDGRSSVVSWYNLLVRLRKRTDVTISDVIRGQKVKFGDWTSHVRRWNPLQRPQTLLLRYPDLLSEPDEQLQRVSEFLGIPRTAPWNNNFQELHRLMPEFFHRGSDEKNLAQMSADEQALFWSLHESCMREFGFGEKPPLPAG